MTTSGGRSMPTGHFGRTSPQARHRRASFVVALTMVLLTIASPSEAAGSLGATQRKLNAVAARLSAIQSVLAQTESRIQATRLSLKRASGSLAMARGGIAGLARNLYMQGDMDAQALLNAGSVAELADRIAFVEHIQAYDRDVLQRVSIGRIHLTRREAALDKLLAKQRKLLRDLRGQERELAKLFREQKAALAAAARRRRASRSGAPIFSGGLGVFKVCPVDQPRAYTDDFGAPRYGGGYHTHKGNDILAPRGTPVRAPFDGTVKTNTSGQGGRQARVFGAAGHVFNAHLNGFSGAGGFVTAGTIIGYVGDSGNAQGGPTHDHFEWHPGNGGAVSPYRFLNQVC